MFKKLFLSLAAVTIFSTFIHAEIIEVRKKSAINPTVSFSGIPGDEALSRELKRFLSVCGWFDPVSPGKDADYTLRAEKAGSSINLHVYRNSQRLTGWRFPGASNPRETAKTIVDTVIERIFEQLKVRGFCRSRIAFCAENAPGIRNIFLCDIDGGNVEQVTNYRTLNVEPCWSPSGKSICFSKYGKTGIDVVETTSNAPRRSRILSSFRGINTGAAISPDGKYMAVILSPDHQVDLYLLGLHQRFQKRLTRGIAVEASPCWSPDGKKLAFVSDRAGNPRIYTINTDGSGLTMLPKVPDGVDAVTPAWSSDNKIAYATRIRSTGNYVIAVYDMKTGENKVVSRSGGNWESPGWAADNRQVVCKRTVNGKSSLWIVDTRNGRERELLRTGTKLYDPAWSPCIKR
ncbi:MAG: PD40 domain-containing protein [Lentisphaeria bacterium]|nr:PD40 domain-containing protein [Lentisphaeria bacterium]